MSYTKGKWKVTHSESKDAYNVIGTVPGLKYKIARCPYLQLGDLGLDEMSKKEAEANARLISAAPDLLEALRGLLEVKEWKDKHGKDEHYLKAQTIAWENAKAAIKKATE